jgi:hypothetical protein
MQTQVRPKPWGIRRNGCGGLSICGQVSFGTAPLLLTLIITQGDLFLTQEFCYGANMVSTWWVQMMYTEP